MVGCTTGGANFQPWFSHIKGQPVIHYHTFIQYTPPNCNHHIYQIVSSLSKSKMLKIESK